MRDEAEMLDKLAELNRRIDELRSSRRPGIESDIADLRTARTVVLWVLDGDVRGGRQVERSRRSPEVSHETQRLVEATMKWRIGHDGLAGAVDRFTGARDGDQHGRMAAARWLDDNGVPIDPEGDTAPVDMIDETAERFSLIELDPLPERTDT